jgi:hypothetical protein
MYRRTLTASWAAQPGELTADQCIEDIFAGGDGWGDRHLSYGTNQSSPSLGSPDMNTSRGMGDDSGSLSDEAEATVVHHRHMLRRHHRRHRSTDSNEDLRRQDNGSGTHTPVPGMGQRTMSGFLRSGKWKREKHGHIRGGSREEDVHAPRSTPHDEEFGGVLDMANSGRHEAGSRKPYSNVNDQGIGGVTGGGVRGRASLEQQANAMKAEVEQGRRRRKTEVDELDIREDLRSWRL